MTTAEARIAAIRADRAVMQYLDRQGSDETIIAALIRNADSKLNDYRRIVATKGH